MDSALEKKGIADPYLMKLCPTCHVSPKKSHYTMAISLADVKNKVQAVTATLNPKYHNIPPKDIRYAYKKMVENVFQNRKTPNSLEATFEYTENGVIHMHALCVGRKSVLGELYTAFRRLGYVQVKPIFDCDQWLEYMFKDQDEESLHPLKHSA